MRNTPAGLHDALRDVRIEQKAVQMTELKEQLKEEVMHGAPAEEAEHFLEEEDPLLMTLGPPKTALVTQGQMDALTHEWHSLPPGAQRMVLAMQRHLLMSLQNSSSYTVYWTCPSKVLPGTADTIKGGY